MEGIDQSANKKYSGVFAWPTVLIAYSLGFLWIACLFLTHRDVIPLWLCSIICFVLCYLAFTPLHEAAHNNIRGSFRHLQWVSNSVGHLCGTMLLGPFQCFSFLHLTHHAHTNEAGEDPDVWVAGASLWSVLWRCLTIMPHYYIYFFTCKKRAAQKIFLSTILYFIFLIVSVLVISHLTSYQLIVFGWLIPALTANAALAFMLDYVPHAPHRTRERYKNTNVIFGKIIYILSMGHSYHVIHHLWPRIPFYRYKQVFNEYRAVLEKEGTPIFSSFSQLFQGKH